MEEIWKDIEGYEGIYQVSNLGRVKSLARSINRKGQKPLILKTDRILRQTSNNKTKYKYVSLCVNNKIIKTYIHRILAQAFIPNPRNKKEVNHINGIRNDNRLINLEWVTPKENINHAYDTKLNRNRKAVMCIETGNVFCGIAFASRATGINSTCIGSVCKGSRITAGGYHWEYYEDVT